MTENLPEPGERDPNPGPELQDPELERQRAEQAAERERESRQTDDTKFEELRDEQQEETHEAAQLVADVPEPLDDDN